MLWGFHCLKGWSKTQKILSLSSGEAELGALVKGSTEAIGMKSIMEDFGIVIELEVATDSTAAIGMVEREGLGKVRHLAVADLWVQEKRRAGVIEYRKVDGKENPADAMTKGINEESMMKHLHFMGFVECEGRNSLAPELTSSVEDSSRD